MRRGVDDDEVVGLPAGEVELDPLGGFVGDAELKVNGVVALPDTPGLGMDLDESKIETQRIVRWTD